MSGAAPFLPAVALPRRPALSRRIGRAGLRRLARLLRELPPPLRRPLGQALRGGLRFGRRLGAEALCDRVEALAGRVTTGLDYPAWVRRHETLAPEDLAAIAAHVARMAHPPLISVVMPVHDTPATLLEEAVDSVRRQLYPRWELCIADDASTRPHVAPLLARLADSDPRIRVARRAENGRIARATNTALALAAGEFVALMDHDDLLHPLALYEVAAELERHPEAEILFTDEDQIDAAGRRSNPAFKPGWNPSLLRGCNYVNHLTVYRRRLVERLGGLRPAMDGSQDYDLLLRAAAEVPAARIRHIPWVLYHWRRGGARPSFSEASRDRCLEAARRALEADLAARGERGRVEQAPGLPDWWRVRHDVAGPSGEAPLVSVIIPTRDRAGLLANCLRGVLEETRYPRLEVLVADNGSVEPATQALFDSWRDDPRFRVIDCPGPFNYAAINNRAAAEARGEILLLLNNDIEVLEPGWLEEMVSLARQPDVGAVGARLLYPDGRLQHGGIALGVGRDRVAGHLFHRQHAAEPGYMGMAGLVRDVAAVTGACLAVRREAFEAVGGLDAESLAVAFNDVDLCLLLRAQGLRNLWTPFATLVHHESVSRGSDAVPGRRERFAAEAETMRRRWGPVLDNDPCASPHFLPGTVRLAARSRPRRSWEVAPEG